MEERIYRSPAPEIEIPEVNLTEHVIAGAAGGAITPINPLLTPDEVAKQAGDAAAKLTIDDPAATVDAADPGGEPEPVEVDPDDLAALPYSSGTTGAMKGVMLTHRGP